ncbi:hypothetical protein D3C84_1171680 [compost metagenome]
MGNLEVVTPSFRNPVQIERWTDEQHYLHRRTGGDRRGRPVVPWICIVLSGRSDGLCPTVAELGVIG